MIPNLRERVAAIRWFHTIDLGSGIVTQGVDYSPYRLARLQLPDSLANQSVLDIGAWDGFFSFEAERRGASRVVSCDYYSWHGVGWGTGNGKVGFELARAALGSRVEDVDIDVMDLCPERIGTFDVVLFLGVLYHMRHPLLALERVASVAHGLLVLETVVDMVGVRRPAAAFYPGTELNGDPTNWWGPNVPAVVGMLKDVGFERVQVVTPQPSVPYRLARALWHRLDRGSSIALTYRQDRAVFHAWKSKALADLPAFGSVAAPSLMTRMINLRIRCPPVAHQHASKPTGGRRRLRQASGMARASEPRADERARPPGPPCDSPTRFVGTHDRTPRTFDHTQEHPSWAAVRSVLAKRGCAVVESISCGKRSSGIPSKRSARAGSMVSA